MKLRQFQNPNLSIYSYAVLDELNHRVVLIDPERNMAQYLAWAEENKANITDVIETHPHADFVSSHLEISLRTGAKIHVSKLYGAKYPHHTFDSGDYLRIGELEFRCKNTPGHSPDSICIILKHENKDICIFTGDTLFIGDCGRPDLRENAGHIFESREILASQMYFSLRSLIEGLSDDVLIYPAHGAGSLCGKALSDAHSSTLGAEKIGNWSLGNLSEEEFVKTLISDQPFTPGYFGYDVGLNQKGAPIMEGILQGIPYLNRNEEGYSLDKTILIIDTRDKEDYNLAHYPNSFNLMKGASFSTWLGSIVKPEEPFYLLANCEDDLDSLLLQTADIGYDLFLKGMMTLEGLPFEKPHLNSHTTLDYDHFNQNQNHYTIIDVRNPGEVRDKLIFSGSVNIPLFELRNRLSEIPLDKPIVVHCAAGYRSAAAASILRTSLQSPPTIFDFGVKIKELLALKAA